jgi:hypothetical protein
MSKGKLTLKEIGFDCDIKRINTPKVLLVCLKPACINGKNTVEFRPHRKYSWAIVISCSTCEQAWAVCKECSNTRVQLTKVAQLSRHNRLCHSSVNEAVNEDDPLAYNDNLSEEEGIDEEIVVDPQNQVEEAITWTSSQIMTHLTEGFGRFDSTQYFTKSFTSKLDGLSYLAARSQTSICSFTSKDVDPTEVKLRVYFADLCYHLSVIQRKKMCTVIQFIIRVISRQIQMLEHPELITKLTIHCLSAFTDVRRQIMEGKHAFVTILPHPEVYTYKDHCFILPSACLADLVGHGRPVLFYRRSQQTAGGEVHYPIKTLYETNMAKVLFPTSQAHNRSVSEQLGMVEFSDDCEANSVKSNRKSGIWVKLISFFSPNDNDPIYTYPVACGPKGSDHSHVERAIQTDLWKLASYHGKPIYDGNRKTVINVQAKLFASLQDQPERRSANWLSLGNSRFHARFAVSCDWSQLVSVLLPCPACLQHMRTHRYSIDVLYEFPKCNSCTNWAIDLGDPLLQYIPQHDYPADACNYTEAGTAYLEPFHLTYDILKKALRLAHDQYVADLWTEKNVTAFLSVHCLNLATIAKVIMHGDNCLALSELERIGMQDTPFYDEIISDSQNNPGLYQPCAFPDTYERGLELKQHINVAMHLLFLGIVKTSAKQTWRWLASQKKVPHFTKLVKGSLEVIEKLGLSWCKVLPVNGIKFGGWVSENFLGLSRLIKWYYSLLQETVATEIITIPDCPQSKWLKRHNKEWLDRRGIPADGLAKELSVLVATLLRDPQCPPATAKSGTPVQQVMTTLISLQDMIQLLMIREITNEGYYAEASRRIRIFMTNFDAMDKPLRMKDNKKPKWISSYNFLTLLSIPDQVRQFGPLRLLWEGSVVGEGYLGYVKNEIKLGLRTGWQQNIMKKILRKKALTTILQQDNQTKEGGV